MAEPKWNKVDLLASNPHVGAVHAHPDGGYGFIGTSLRGDEGSTYKRLLMARASLVRVTPASATPVWEGKGRVVCVDTVGEVGFAVVGTIKEDESPGSDYYLLRSTDRGMTWQPRAAIVLPSITSVLAVGADEVWVHGAHSLARSIDAGGYWIAVELTGTRNAVSERLRRTASGVAVIGDRGVTESTSGGSSWKAPTFENATITDLTPTHALGIWDGIAGVALRAPDSKGQPFAVLERGRLPLRLCHGRDAAQLRVLSRQVDGSRGAEITVHHYDPDERTWTDYPLGISHNTDIAGSDFGIGVDVIGGVYVATDS